MKGTDWTTIASKRVCSCGNGGVTAVELQKPDFCRQARLKYLTVDLKRGN